MPGSIRRLKGSVTATASARGTGRNTQPTVRSGVSRLRYARNAEQMRARVAAYRAANPELIRERQRASYAANRERRREESRKYAAEHRREAVQRAKRWAEANPERACRNKERHYAANRDRIAQRVRDWVAANPERARAQGRKDARIRKARKRGVVIVPFTVEQLAAKVAYWGDRCWCCGGPAEAIHHVKPIVAGGAEMLCNLRPVCTSCNSGKRDKWPLPATALLGVHQRGRLRGWSPLAR
jgi:5-methylcytosine-specific restriction endonuclease McrA